MLVRLFPYQHSDRLVAIGESNLQRRWHMNTVSYRNFRRWQAENRTLSNIGVYTWASSLRYE